MTASETARGHAGRARRDMAWRAWLTGVAVLFLSACGPATISDAPTAAGGLSAPNEARTPRARACRWLEQQQSADGGWRSSIYPYLASGQALTPFVLYALLEARDCGESIDEAAVTRALGYLRRHVDANGVIGLADREVPEYPNYATSYALRCLHRVGDPADAELRARMRSYLVDQQVRSANGHDPSSLAHGGWGMGAPVPRGSPDHMDISYTRHVLQSLAESGPLESELRQRALVLLRLLQRHPDETRIQPRFAADSTVAPYDGGFYFSPIVTAANKGDRSRGDLASYSTATCDGLLALLALGLARDDVRVGAAVGWLTTHARGGTPTGIAPDDPSGWAEQLRCYHFAVQAEALAATEALGVELPGSWRSELVRAIADFVQPDGSYVNSGGALMKEDDPLVATALVLIALNHAQP